MFSPVFHAVADRPGLNTLDFLCCAADYGRDQCGLLRLDERSCIAKGVAMIRHVLKFLFVLAVFGLLLSGVSKQVFAQEVPQYECQSEVVPDPDFPKINTVQCVIKEPVDEKTLRAWACQTYDEVRGHDYNGITIVWKLYLESRMTPYLSDIGFTRFLNGNLVDLHIPQVREKEVADESTIIINFLARLEMQDSIDKLQKNIPK